jgi:hypothetical protein
MGYELRRQLREALGPDITGLQRAVALEIADDANERTRRSSVPLDKLVLWTGAKDASVVRNALKRLAASGWEFRVPIGKGKDGRVLFAVPGQRMTYMVPPFEGGATATPYDPQGGATAHSEGATATPWGSKGEQGLPLGGAGATPSEDAARGADTAGQSRFSVLNGTPEGVAVATPSNSQGGAVATPSSYKQSASKHAGADDTSYGIPDAARPLIDSMTASGIVVRWPFKGDQWFPLLALINKCGVQALVEYARRTADRTPVDSAKYFMRGWSELPPKPADGAAIHRPRPQLRVAGQSPEERGIF